jgi:hypothetical protein
LIGFFAEGNPLAIFVLSEPLAATNLAGTVTSLQNQGVSVFTYPLAVRLASPFRTGSGTVEFSLTGPPGIYAVQSSTNLASTNWVTATNKFGNAVFTDASTLAEEVFLSARR